MLTSGTHRDTKTQQRKKKKRKKKKKKMLGLGVTAVMILVEFLEVGLNTVSKAAMSRGMSNFVFIVYSNALAIFILLASCFIFYRKRTLPPLTVLIICKIFLLGLIGCSVQMFIYAGIQYSSPTLASVMTDLTPAFTFILAIISRMEKLDLRVQSSQARSFGTMLSIAGALVVTLYKGLPIINTSSPDNLSNELVLFTQSNWVIGGMLLAAGGFCLALLYIVQTWIIKEYPEELMVTLICCIFVTIQSATVSLFVERDPNAWRLKPDIELIAIGYSAVFSAAFRNVVHTWACHKKGPVYACMFKPLGIAIAVVMGVSFLGDTLYLGSVIGAAIIAFGFYAVIWGQTKQEKMVDNEGICNSESSSPKASLLQNESMVV